jgi:hypothetical protein
VASTADNFHLQRVFCALSHTRVCRKKEYR